MLVATLFVGCGDPPGRPRTDSVPLAPNEVVEFGALYADNCAACHGAQGRGGAAIALANPVYLAIVDDRSMRATIGTGVRGTSMPAFAQRAGGMLTEKQIDALVDGIRSNWSHPGALAGAVVVRRSQMPTLENVSFALRAGVEAPGTIPPRGETRS